MAKKVIIIGAGLGGISAAISLAAEGFSVEVYEKNNKPGGKLNILKKKGSVLTWDLPFLLFPIYLTGCFSGQINDWWIMCPFRRCLPTGEIFLRMAR